MNAHNVPPSARHHAASGQPALADSTMGAAAGQNTRHADYENAEYSVFEGEGRADADSRENKNSHVRVFWQFDDEFLPDEKKISGFFQA